ncbi:MAG: EamA family transporter RarD, partial [Proteobacteria bacterium]|nr:EamA family transporter RarD [Pseudomonadota bacterium]
MPEKPESEGPGLRSSGLAGLGSGGSAFLIWGFSPLFWKLLKGVPAFETTMHRVVWSFLFLVPLLVFQHAWKDLLPTLKNRRLIPALLLSACLVSLNWLVYIWAINNDLVLQASLGYYINPLVNVLLGVCILRERLRAAQIAAVVLAAAGVIYLALQYGRFPWVALSLAFSFGLYGLIRKISPVGALVGLSVETLLLSMPALGYLIWLEYTGRGTFGHHGPIVDLYLVGTALVTALPLLLFTRGARRLKLSTM